MFVVYNADMAGWKQILKSYLRSFYILCSYCMMKLNVTQSVITYFYLRLRGPKLERYVDKTREILPNIGWLLVL